MPWKEICPMDERMSFLVQVNESDESFSALCRRYEISRKTGYKWIARYEQEGPPGLQDRRPLAVSHPDRVADDLVDIIVATRKEHPYWGPKKLLAWLKEHRPEHGWPAASTIGDKLHDHGLIRPRRRRVRAPMSVDPLAPTLLPDDTWCIDFKGHFVLGDKTRCYPLTVTDQHTRYLLKCEAMTEPRFSRCNDSWSWRFVSTVCPIGSARITARRSRASGWVDSRSCRWVGSSSASFPSASSPASRSKMAVTSACTRLSSRRPRIIRAPHWWSSSACSTASVTSSTTIVLTKLSDRSRPLRVTAPQCELCPTSPAPPSTRTR